MKPLITAQLESYGRHSFGSLKLTSVSNKKNSSLSNDFSNDSTPYSNFMT